MIKLIVIVIVFVIKRQAAEAPLAQLRRRNCPGKGLLRVDDADGVDDDGKDDTQKRTKIPHRRIDGSGVNL